MPDPPHRRRTTPPRHQGLVDSPSRGTGRTARDTNSNGPEDEKSDATRLGNKPDVDCGRGFERFTQEYLHDTLGLYRIPRRRADLPRAKV